MSVAPRALRVLDEVQHLAQLERFDATAFLATVREEMPPAGATLTELADQLDGLRGLLAELDRFAQKSMRIRLTSSTDVLPRQLHTLLYSTVVAYDHDLPLLRRRLDGALARVGAAAAGERVMGLAEQVLEARAVLRRGVMALAESVATAWLPGAQRAARDRSQPDEQRERWKRACVDLEQVAARGDTLDRGSFAERLDRIPTPEDPPEEPRPDRFSLIELD